MSEFILLAKNVNGLVRLDVKPVDAVGSKSVTDKVSGKTLASSDQSSNTAVITDGAGDKALFFSNGHFEHSAVDFDIKNRPFKISFDLLVSEYVPQEGAVFSQLNAGTGSGSFAATMTGGTGLLSFYWCRDGSLTTRDLIVSSQIIPLNTYTSVSIEYTGSSINMYFNGVLVAQKANTLVYSAALPLGIGGHFGYSQYNSKGSMKNIIVQLIG